MDLPLCVHIQSRLRTLQTVGQVPLADSKDALGRFVLVHLSTPRSLHTVFRLLTLAGYKQNVVLRHQALQLCQVCLPRP